MITSLKIGGARRHIVDISDAQTFLRTNELVKRLRHKGKRADDERTIFQLTTFYLNKSYQTERLHKLLTNFDFVAAKLVNSYDARRRTYDVQSLISDYEFARDFPEIWDQGSLPLIQRAIELAAHILADDPSQLPEQLLARLLAYELADVQRFLQRAKRYKSAPWLRPLTRSLPDPDGPQLRTLTDHSGQLRAVAIAPRLKRFVSATDSILTVWDFEGREERFAPTDQSDEVTDLIITPDEKFIVMARRNSVIEVCTLQTLRKEFTLSGHESAVLALATTPDGRLISASTDKTVNVWDLKSRRQIVTLDQGASVHSLAVFSDGQRLVVGTGRPLFGSTADNMIKVWDLESGTELYTSGGHNCSIDALTVSPDGKVIIAAVNETLKVWDWQSKTEPFTLTGHRSRIHSVTVTPNGKWLISSGDDIKVWEIKRRQMLVALKGHYGPVNDIAITPDGQHLISASKDKTLKIWNIIRAVKSASTGHQESVNALVVTPDNRFAISASKDHTLKVWDMQHQQVRLTLEGHADWVSDVAVTADSRRAISASRDGTIKVWDLYTGGELLTLNGQDEHFSAFAVTPDGQQIVSAVNDTLKVWDVGRQVELFTLVGHRATVNAITITPDGKRAITVSDDQTLRVWDMENGLNLHTLQVDSEPHYVVSLDSLDDVEELLSNPIKDERMTALAVTSDGQRALSGSRNGTLRMWDIESETELFALRDSESGITAIAISDRFAFTTSGVPHLSSDNTLRVWHLQKKEVIARFVGESPMNACAVGSDGVTVLAGDISGRVHFLRLDLEPREHHRVKENLRHQDDGATCRPAPSR